MPLAWYAHAARCWCFVSSKASACHHLHPCAGRGNSLRGRSHVPRCSVFTGAAVTLMAAPGPTSAEEQSQLPQGANWSAYLLVSPTRSSLAGYARAGEVDREVERHNGALNGDPGPPETALLRPWKLAESVDFPSREVAMRAACVVSRSSGFRARLKALRRESEHAAGDLIDSSEEAQQGADETSALGGASLDSLTYVRVEFMNPRDRDRSVSVVALVDTGSTDCDLRGSLLDQLGLRRQAGKMSYFATAAGRTIGSSAYEVVVRVEGCEAKVLVNPADEADGEKSSGDDDESSDGDGDGGGDNAPDEDDVDRIFGFGCNSDDAVLGSGALAALGLLVDCRGRRLLRLPKVAGELPSLRFGRGNQVPVEFSNPSVPSRRFRVRGALVDTGCTDVDLSQRAVAELGLEADPSEGTAQFETAGGITIEAPIYRVALHILGQRASVRASPSEEPGDADHEGVDEALLGHDALAALGLLVDCKGRRLLAALPAS